MHILSNTLELLSTFEHPVTPNALSSKKTPVYCYELRGCSFASLCYREIILLLVPNCFLPIALELHTIDIFILLSILLKLRILESFIVNILKIISTYIFVISMTMLILANQKKCQFKFKEQKLHRGPLSLPLLPNATRASIGVVAYCGGQRAQCRAYVSIRSR